MSMKDINYIQTIILRYLNHESTTAETTILMQWISESKANADEFHLIQSIWEDSEKSTFINVDIDNAWQSVQSRINEKKLNIRLLSSWKIITAIAASILIFSSIVYLLWPSSSITWQEITALNGNKRMELSDKTVITLRQGSKFMLPNNYGKDNRQIKLEGEAFFEVEHNKDLPFYVLTPKSIIEDIGTKFFVQSTPALEKVTVLEGEVSFKATNKDAKPHILTRGESAVLKDGNPKLQQEDTTNLLAWRTRIMVFNQSPLNTVARDLEDYYQLTVELKGNIDSIKITAQFNNEPLAQVIKELNLLTGLNFQLSNDRLIISK